MWSGFGKPVNFDLKRRGFYSQSKSDKKCQQEPVKRGTRDGGARRQVLYNTRTLERSREGM